MSIVLHLDMGFDRESLLRLLPGALGDAARQVGAGFAGGRGEATWTLTLEPLPDRRLGALRLPHQRVVLRFEGHAPSEVEAFLARLHRALLRAGG